MYQLFALYLHYKSLCIINNDLVSKLKMRKYSNKNYDNGKNYQKN